jgi:hypothetical protein
MPEIYFTRCFKDHIFYTLELSIGCLIWGFIHVDDAQDFDLKKIKIKTNIAFGEYTNTLRMERSHYLLHIYLVLNLCDDHISFCPQRLRTKRLEIGEYKEIKRYRFEEGTTCNLLKI